MYDEVCRIERLTQHAHQVIEMSYEATEETGGWGTLTSIWLFWRRVCNETVQTYSFVRMLNSTCTNTHIHARTHTYMHTQINTNTHTHTRTQH